jgi:hypothetical protein
VAILPLQSSNKAWIGVWGRWTETADGATPQNVVFSGKYTLNGNESAVRDTFSFKKREFSHLGEIHIGREWRKLNEEKCTK